MEYYQNGEIKIDGVVNVRQLKQFYMKEQINEHMTFYLSGDITQEDADEYEKRKLLGRPIRFYNSLDSGEVLAGCSIVTKANMSVSGRRNSITIEGASASIRMAADRKKRSFQNRDQTYREVLRQLGGEEAAVVYSHREEIRTGFPVIQYEETDWDLLRRLAGRLQTVIVPDVTSGGTRVFFGLPAGKVHHLDSVGDTRLSLRYDEDGTPRLCRTIFGRADMRLGDAVIMGDHRWIIVEKQVIYENNKLETQYTLGRIMDWNLPFTYNSGLRGAAIRGRVMKRKNESLKLWLDIDPEQKESDAFWYPYLPGTGNLMYATPETDAEVILYFPDGREENGIVVNSFLSDSKDRERKHTIKELKIPSGKELTFRPGAIELSGGKKQKVNTLFLGEETGVQFTTGKSIRMIADEGVSLRSSLSCATSAANYISVSQTGGKNRFEMTGNQILFHAEKYRVSSMPHKSNRPATERGEGAGDVSFSSLYGPFIGMLAQGACDPMIEKMLGGIPQLGSVTGPADVRAQMGLKIRKR